MLTSTIEGHFGSDSSTQLLRNLNDVVGLGIEDMCRPKLFRKALPLLCNFRHNNIGSLHLQTLNDPESNRSGTKNKYVVTLLNW